MPAYVATVAGPGFGFRREDFRADRRRPAHNRAPPRRHGMTPTHSHCRLSRPPGPLGADRPSAGRVSSQHYQSLTVEPESTQLAPETPRIAIELPQALTGTSRSATSWLPERTPPLPEVATSSAAMAGAPVNSTPPAAATMALAAKAFFSMFSPTDRPSREPIIRKSTICMTMNTPRVQRLLSHIRRPCGADSDNFFLQIGRAH